MASIFKKNGKGNYIIVYFDLDGRRRERSSRTTDLATAKRIGSKIESDLALRRDGVIDSKLDRFALEARRPINQHVDDFLESAGNRVSNQQASQLRARISRVLGVAKLSTLADLTLSSIELALGELLRKGYEQTFDNGRVRKVVLSARTASYFAKAMKQFTRWLLRDGRVSVDPLISLKASTTDADNVYNRRELLPEEIERIVDTAEKGSRILGMEGFDRAMVYRVAGGTGFRANELRNLTPESFDLEGDLPTITVNAAFSKRRRVDTQPIRADLATLLRPWLAKKQAGHPVFNLPQKSAKMLHRDMAIARNTWLEEAKTKVEREKRAKSSFLLPVDSDGLVADFHSTRHGFISTLTNGCVPIKVAQELARHSTPVLTIGRYSHVRVNDLAGALEKLVTPGLKPVPDQHRIRATGRAPKPSSAGGKHPQHFPHQTECISQRFQATLCEKGTSVPSSGTRPETSKNAVKTRVLRRNATRCETEGVGARTQDLRLKRPLLYH